MERPIFPVGTHPIEIGLYTLPTPEILRLMDHLKQIVRNGAPGTIVYGHPRFGKTRATFFALNYLPKELHSDIPIFITECKQSRIPSERSFYKDMLDDFNFDFSSSRDVQQLRKQIVHLFIEKGERSPVRKVVLFIDEAHRMTEWQYNCLIDIYNELIRAQICMTVISVGQEELKNRRSFFLRNKKSQIIGRFMTSEYQYHGMQTDKELSACLYSYDITEFPEGSGWTFTRYFFPEAYNEGKRLRDFGKELFKLFIALRQEYHLKKKMELPMEYLALTVENALKEFGINGNRVEWLTLNHWKEAINRSGYIQSEIYMGLAEGGG